MYPYVLFWDIDLYSVFLLLGVLAAFVIFRILGDRKRFTAKYQNFVLLDGFLSVVVGYLGAVLSQAVNNYAETGVFEVNGSTGATFLGGLLFGAGFFLVFYFTVGIPVFKKDENANVRYFPELLSVAGACIPAAHALGRIGCLFAGCCYGKPTDSFIGIKLVDLPYKTIPVQIFESVFLFLLFAAVLILNVKVERFKLGMPVYMVAYGIWRYFAEFMRGDDRGASFIKIFTPSQFIAILFVAGGILLGVILYKRYYAKRER
ncbi:MAG: prolipoprotein diacylglyceryl transferase [Clostridia bacterium]|nr:prolipoprotein diacylglyceryl transferase [Clostridia bacterium]